MKKHLFFFFALALMACSNDDDGGSSANPNRDLVVGTWNLTELTISPAQDINGDGNTTTNVVAELACITGRITLSDNNTWTFSGNDVVVTTITGGLFNFQCSAGNRTEGGNWDIEGNVLRLADGTGSITVFTFNSSANTLTNIIGETLPGLQAEVYTKQ